MTAPGLTLDTGALLASERGDPKIRALLRRVAEHGAEVHVPAGVLLKRGAGEHGRAALPGYSMPPTSESLISTI